MVLSFSALLQVRDPANGLTKTQLSWDTAVSKSIVSAILTGKKRSGRQMIREFTNDFEVDASILAASFLRRKGTACG